MPTFRQFLESLGDDDREKLRHKFQSLQQFFRQNAQVQVWRAIWIEEGEGLDLNRLGINWSKSLTGVKYFIGSQGMFRVGLSH